MASKQKRLKFLPIPSKFSDSAGSVMDRMGLREILKDIRVSVWIWVATGLMFVSTVLYFISFVTNGWGYMNTADGKWWQFGLWQCCRDDGLCIGTQWTVFYSATRACSVLVLIGHVVGFCYMIGYILERILEYDPCTVIGLASVCVSNTLFMIIGVSCFGAKWAEEVGNEFRVLRTGLSYSFALACVTIFLNIGAATMCFLELRVSFQNLVDKHKWYRSHPSLKRRYRKKEPRLVPKDGEDQADAAPHDVVYNIDDPSYDMTPRDSRDMTTSLSHSAEHSRTSPARSQTSPSSRPSSGHVSFNVSDVVVH